MRRVTLYVQATSPSPWTDPLAPVRHEALGGYAGLFGILDACSPCVEELSLEGIDFQTSAYLASSVIFKHLRVLHLGSVSTSTSVILLHCSKMPRLASLSVVLRRSADSDDLGARSQRGDERHGMPTLSALEVLRVAGAPLEIEDILHAVDSPTLHTAALSVTVPDHDTDGWARCASVLSARFSRSLRTLRAECLRSGTVVPSHARPFAQYLKPLLPLQQLSDCVITVEDPAGVALTNEDVETIVSAWPSLSSLEVAFRGGRTGAARPTLTSLLPFAYRCPRLKTLRLPLSQDLTSLGPELVMTSCARGTLRELWIAGVSFSRKETELVASFLSRFFPDIDLVPMINAGILHVD